MAEIGTNEIMKIVVVGHVDHGKSTVIGRLLYDTFSLPEGTVDKVKRIAKETGKPFEYAYLLDAFEEEQKQGITIDTTQIQFQTKKRDYVIIDAPGHKEFLKNMISGAANAEAALLIIDAKEGVQEQTKRHAYILSLLGIKKVYVVLNKMDLVNYSEQDYTRVRSEMADFLATLGVFPIDYIPVSAYYGENILTSSEKLNWFSGKSIIDAIDGIEKDKGLDEKALRFPIQDVYKFDDRRIIAGRIESGTLKVGDKIAIYPEGKSTTVKSIEYWADRDEKDIVKAGESVGITVSDEFFNKRGEVISFESTKPIISNAFKANLFWMGKTDLIKGKKYKIKVGTQETEGEVNEILKVIDASTLDSSNAATERIILNDVAEVVILTKDKIAFDKFSDCSASGRFVIVDGYNVAGGGIIVDEAQAQSTQNSISFVKGDLNVRGDVFEEFYYNSNDFKIGSTFPTSKTYGLGDEIPTKGDSYTYPDNFDIIVLRDNSAVLIRDKKVSDIVGLEEYKYAGLPLANGRGFGIKVKSTAEFEEFLAEYSQISEQSEQPFLAKWQSFETYRKVSFHNNFWII